MIDWDEAMPLAGLLGVERVDETPGEVRARLAWREDLGTNFLSPVRDGYVEAVSRPLKVGRTVIVVETQIVDAEGRAVARVVQSQAVLR